MPPTEAAGALRQYPDPGYIWPSDPRTLAAPRKVEGPQGRYIIHWSLYSHIGQDGSWSLHRRRLGGFTDPLKTGRGDENYHSWYCDQARSFTGREDFNAEGMGSVRKAGECAIWSLRQSATVATMPCTTPISRTLKSTSEGAEQDAILSRDVRCLPCTQHGDRRLFLERIGTIRGIGIAHARSLTITTSRYRDASCKVSSSFVTPTVDR